MTNSQSPPSPAPLADNASKRKRRPAGTPDPDAEVVALSPRTLLESDRYVCEICNQGFQREQNLQMHRRRHKVPWKLLKRDAGAGEARKRVFVCPEPSCLHHDPCHALGDLVGIKKHFRRKHSTNRQWVCEKCSKAYAVQSDYKAHLKTCGTRGHSCDCGRVFSRVESFIEHQDACNANRAQTPSSPSPSSDTNFSAVAWTPRMLPSFTTVFLRSEVTPMPNPTPQMELQLLPASGIHATTVPSFSSATISPISEEAHFTKLELSVGSGLGSARDPEKIREEAKEQLRLAAADKAVADEARMQARRMMEIAEQEFANAKRIRMQAQAELNRMHVMRDHATKKIKSTMMEITCQSCKQLFRGKPTVMASEVNSLAASYMSSVTEGEGEYDDDDRHHQTMACNT